MVQLCTVELVRVFGYFNSFSHFSGRLRFPFTTELQPFEAPRSQYPTKHVRDQAFCLLSCKLLGPFQIRPYVT